MPDALSTPVVVASPHSGRHYPLDFLSASVLDSRAIRSSEDAFIDVLVGAAPEQGAPLLTAEYPRAYLDLNRSPDELDPAVISGIGRVVQTPRINSGLGVIPRVVANGRAIYRGKLSRAEVDARLTQIWHPYHDCLARLLSVAKARFGRCLLLDFHSMPREALDPIMRPGLRRPDVVLGDRFGASASASVVDLLEQAFRDAGLEVSRNTPFAGAYVVQSYGRPAHGQHAVQIEIDRSLYMDERDLRPHEGFEEMRRLLSDVLAKVIGAQSETRPMAAE